jgi:methylthioribose-1-phosphate isomerase
MAVDALPRTIWWESDFETGRATVCLIDQTKLPLVEKIMRCEHVDELCDAITTLAVRGAPALGVAAALALALWSENESTETDVASYLASLDRVTEKVATARPTAVNLSWGAKRACDHAHELADGGANLGTIKVELVNFAKQMIDEDERINRAIGDNGTSVLAEGSNVLTHCNAGSLATAYYGTALGVIYSGFSAGRVSHVWVDETRPVNQGGRLTAWELGRAGIPATLICDNMAASVMRAGHVDAVIVGADRICANGDTANKIGTYGLAVLAREHRVPFYIAAPLSTIDPSLSSGDQIVIEQRNAREVEGVPVSGTIAPSTPTEKRALSWMTQEGPISLSFKGGHKLTISRSGDDEYAAEGWFKNTPQGVKVYNPAFDVTPARYIAGIITEAGVLRKGTDGVFHLEHAHEPGFSA